MHASRAITFQAETGPRQAAEPAGFGRFGPGISACPSQPRAALPSLFLQGKETLPCQTTTSGATRIISRAAQSTPAALVPGLSGYLPLLRSLASSCLSALWAAVQPLSSIPAVQALTRLSCQPSLKQVLQVQPVRQQPAQSPNNTKSHVNAWGGGHLVPALGLSAADDPAARSGASVAARPVSWAAAFRAVVGAVTVTRKPPKHDDYGDHDQNRDRGDLQEINPERAVLHGFQRKNAALHFPEGAVKC